MKKILMLLFLVASICNSQEKYKEYEMSYLKGKTFRIDISKEKSEKIKFWVDANSMDKSVKSVSISIPEKDLDNFTSILDTLKSTFIEWKKVAKKNNVNDLSKKVEFKSNKYQVAFKYGKWKFDRTQLTARFLVKEKVGYVMILENKNTLVASDNKYIKCSGFAIIFKTPEEFEDLKNKLSLSAAKDFYEKKKKSKDLFKQ